MMRLFLYFFGSAILAAALCLPASAQEYSNGGVGAKGRGPAIVSPVEAFGVHPPGPDPADEKRCVFRCWKQSYLPYYAPASPLATSIRWRPWCYFPLMPYYTPYYIGYLPGRLCHRKPPPYGFDGGWGPGPGPDAEGPSPAQFRYGIYSSVLLDDTIFWNMGGNGLVPYGAPRPPPLVAPDLVDMIQGSRQQGGGGCAGPCHQ